MNAHRSRLGLLARAIASSVFAAWAVLCGPPVAAQSSAPAEEVRYIYASGEAHALALRTDRIAITFDEDLAPPERAAILARQPLSAGATVAEEIPVPRMTIVALSAPRSAGDVSAGLAALRQEAGVSAAHPIYTSYGIDLIPTGRLFLQLEPGIAETQVDAWARPMGLERLERTSWRADNYLLAVSSGSDIDAIAAADRLRGQEGVIYCHPDFIRRLEHLAIPNDTHFGQQWNLHNTGQSSGGHEDVDLDAPEGWEIQKACADVVIAILDEGCDMTHPDYVGSLVAGFDFPGGDADPTPNSWDGHGTSCAGIAAASMNNALGIAGVAGDARIMPIRIAYSTAPGNGWITTDQWLSDAIAWAYLHGADVLSNSWGGGPPSDQIHSAIRDAAAFGRGGLGSVVIFAAGNDNTSPPSYPSLHVEAISVGATSPCDERKSPTSCDPENFWGSNYGPGLDVSAPGVLIPATDIQGAGGYAPGDYYLTFNGTSSATPQVAGLAALLICKFPHYEGTEIRARIEQTCDKVGGYGYDAVTGISHELGHGRVNLYRALSGKPQVPKGPLPSWPSSYQEEGDEPGYAGAIHESAAYAWLGEEYSPEVAGVPDPDGPPNAMGPNGRDAFDDGVEFFPPYLPGQVGMVSVTVSVEDWQSDRFQGIPLYLNIWFDWEADNDWNLAYDWMVQNEVLDPSSWGGNTQTYTYVFPVPDIQIGFHIQNRNPGQFLNVRTRLTYDQPLGDPYQDALEGEVEDDWFLNYVEMFELGLSTVSLVENCPVWNFYEDGMQVWSCDPAFSPDLPPNGYMCAEIYHPLYAGDEHAEMRTPSFDLTELTEAYLFYDHSGVEMVTGYVLLYKNGLVDDTLRVYYDPLPAAPCAPVLPEMIDLTPWCGDGNGDIVIAFAAYPGNPCGIFLPDYQDWKIDNLVVVGVDRIKPAALVPTIIRTSAEEALLTWITPGDDDWLRQAELYNIRYGPETIDPTNWRHALWVRPDMVAALPEPFPPGTPEFVNVARLESGLHHFSVRTLDEVNNISDILDGGVNHRPVVICPDTVIVTEGDSVAFAVSAIDPDYDRVLLLATQKPATAIFRDNGDATGEFGWLTTPANVGDHTVIFLARDWNGATGTDSTLVRVESVQPITGACCLTDGCCEILSQADCASQGGTFQGIATTCNPNPCPPARPDFANHDVGNLELTMTDQGILGFMDGSQAAGSGFIYPAGGVNHLYLGSFWVGESPTYVANRDFDADPAKEWEVTPCPDGRMREGFQGALQTLESRYRDSAAQVPRGLVVEQKSSAFSSPSSDDDFVIVRYVVINEGPDIVDLYFGVYLDFDVDGTGADDTGGTDGARRLAWITDGTGTHTGLRLLDPYTGALPLGNLTLVDNPTFVYPNQYILDADKHAFLSAADPQHVMSSGPSANDYSLLVSAGPLDLASGGQIEVAFALIGAASLSGLQQNADQAQIIYTNATSGVAEEIGTAASGTRLLAAWPNPFRASTQLGFSLASEERVEVSVHDISGRIVRGLLAATLAAGEHRLTWDGFDDRGIPVAGGVYFARLVTNVTSQSRAILLLR